MTRPCGCCQGITVVTPEAEYNRPGLSSLAYRAGTYATFFESMLARLSSVYVDVAPAGGPSAATRIYPLKALTTRELSDPSIALLDAWAVVADVLTFYQERIANEGYLATAVERVSLLELANLIGYKPRPGVAASVFLAFTTAAGFSGQIPAGTRAQSIPGTGETAQFFETGVALDARDRWNSLGPRLTRPVVISPPPDPSLSLNNHLGTNADVIDSVYFQGVATNLKAGDPMLLVLSDSSNQQFLRFAERVNPQADVSRTQVVLKEDLPAATASTLQMVSDVLLRYINDASDQFAGSDLASGIASALSDIQTNLAPALDQAAVAARQALVTVQQAHDVALRRNFTRVEAWSQHLADLMPAIARLVEALARRGGPGTSIPAPAVTASSLQRLGNLLTAISLDRSVPPVNPLRLARSVAVSFASSADTIPRLIASLHPVAAPLVYSAWGNLQPVHFDTQIYALRAKASLFASSFPGASQITQTPGAAGNTTTSVQFLPATIQNCWGDLLSRTATALNVIALDSVYDKITVNSWIAIDQPVLQSDGTPTGERSISYQQVRDIKGQTLDTKQGFTAKVSVLTLDGNWLSADNVDHFANLVKSAWLLRGTIVYAQAEELAMSEEPLDRDVEGSSIELDGLYDALEPGRWIMVSGERTDIPNVSGVNASELAMISAVTQGAGKQSCVPFPPTFVPFEGLFYVSDANAGGDRLVVGSPTQGLFDLLNAIAGPASPDQEFCDVIQLSPGIYADAYIPSPDERQGRFPAFADQLIDPQSPGNTFPLGTIPSSRLTSVYAWRIRQLRSASDSVHTTIQFANSLAYAYNTANVQIYANVAKATHGQTTGEVLGNGDATQEFQKFTLHQSPVTYVSAATPEGAASTLSVTVNELTWEESPDLAAATDRTYITQTGDSGVTSIIFGNGERGARLPTGSSNVKASYRYGIGSAGNVDASQISQLATHPLGLQGVINPLPATGGADPDSVDQIRSNAPLAVTALDRLVSVQDYADFTRTYAGIGKASAVHLSDGRRQLVHITIAGVGDIPIDTSSDLYQNLLLSLQTFGDPFLGVQVCLRRTKLLVISAGIQLAPDYVWESVEPQIRSAVLYRFSFDARDLAQPAFLSEAIAVMQGVEGVLYVNPQVFDDVADDTTIAQFAILASTLRLNQYVTADVAHLDPTAAPDASPCTRLLAAELVYLTPDIPDSLILTQIGG